MLFPTLDFGLFFLLVFIASWALHTYPRPHKLLLLGASYFFYGYWDWRFLALLAFSSTINYFAARLIHNSEDDSIRRWIVAGAVAINLGVLGFFKYYDFFLGSMAEILISMGIERDLPLLDIILPIGISFFTFQGISYVVDVFRRDIDPVDDPVDLFLYISFFPQLVAGPIVRAADFLPQLKVRPVLTYETAGFGFALIAVGLFKKMIIASYLATEIVDDVFEFPAAYSSLDLLIAAYAFIVQIYCDFSGYSDIAIGVAALLGYRFKRNFDRPLAAVTLQELWQRWHISLTSWLRDYLYRPLKGSKRGQWWMYRNLFLTMLVAGLWHGAAWTFVIWGGLQGAMLVVERIVRGWATKTFAERFDRAWKPSQSRAVVSSALGWFITFNAFAITGVFFRASNMTVVSDFYSGMLAMTAGIEKLTPFVALLIVGSVAVQFLPNDLPQRAGRLLARRGPVEVGLAFGCALLAIEMLAPTGVAPFIYFQF